MSITQIEKNEIFCSVVMPVHNGERFLREAIESVLSQTYTNFEFLIIENCSTDSSLKIIRSYNDPRIKLIIEEDCGQVQAYNRGFREAKGEYVFIHDHDDVSHSERFEKQLVFMVKNNIDVCGTFIVKINKKGNIIEYQTKDIADYYIKKKIIYDASAIHNSAVVIKKTLLQKLNFWDINFYPVADTEFFFRAIRMDAKFGNIPEFLYLYRIHNSQITVNPIKKGRILLRDVQLNYLFVKKKELSKADYYFYKSLIYYYRNFLLEAFISINLSLLHKKFNRRIFRYYFLITFLGPILKIIRKFKLYNSVYFLKAKNIFDGFVKIK